jgi:hypothetical protein
MANIPTESRIFADRYFREARRFEALHASRLSPGTTTWRDALQVLFERMDKVGSPIKQAAILKAAITVLQNIDPEEAMHVGFGCHAGKRAASLCFATFSPGRHPLKGVDEEGLSVLQHVISCRRDGGGELVADINLAYISKHAVSRLHERDYKLTAGSAFGIFAFVGILGWLTRYCDKHIEGGLCLRFRDVLVVGSLKHAAVRREADDRLLDGTFYDVRTVLPADEVRDTAMLEQGDASAAAVAAWLKARAGIDEAKVMAEQIPFLPRREDDYTLRTAARA